MGKKKHKNKAGWGQPGFGAMGNGMGGMGYGDYGGYGGMGADMAPMGAGMNGMGQTSGAAAYGAAAGLGMGPGGTNQSSFLHSLQGLVGSRHTEQFLLGALLGAAAVYVLGDEEMRAKLVRTAMKLYSGVAGGFEEIKEQMADIKAEVAAEKRSE